MSQHALEGGGLRVRFTRHGDRYGHVVEAMIANEFVPLLESLEGTTDDHWPPSPPLQSLHIEERGGGRIVALLVGMAGGSHWSLSVESDLTAGQFTWDVACRTRQPLQRLSSTYGIAQPIVVSPTADGWQLGLGDTHWELGMQLIENEPSPQCFVEAGRLVVSVEPRTSTEPQTIRWSYRCGSLAR